MLEPWVQAIIDDNNAARGFVPLTIGQKCWHEGRPVKITDGQYMGRHGISNFWYFDYLDAEGGSGFGYDNGPFTREAPLPPQPSTSPSR